jgi:hypothetical protein
MMSSMRRIWTLGALVAVAGVLLLPAPGAVAGDGPVATKSGAIVNFVTTGKLRVTRRIQPVAVCTVNCDVTGTGVLKGLGGRATFSDSGSFAAGQQFGLFVTIPRKLLKLMKQFPGRFHLTETLTATDPATGAIDSVSKTFNFKR